MATAINLGRTNNFVYDFNADGTVINALSMNVLHNTDGFNFKLPKKYRYTSENPYIGKGLNRNVVEGKEYTGFEADVAEFNDLYMRRFMGLGIDEIVDSTINFSRKNYCDYFPENPYPEDIKKVGNSIKSKSIATYIQKFLDKGLRLLLVKDGKKFLDEYYAEISKIYNYQVPLKDIASKAKVKKKISDYIEDCKTLTKAGRPKARQAHMELAIRDNVKVDMGDVLYYINTGTSKSHADIKKVSHYMVMVEGENGLEKKEMTKIYEKEFKAAKKENPELSQLSTEDYIKKYHPEAIKEEELIFNAALLPREIIESEENHMCQEGQEYNAPKYIDALNKKVKTLLVCFKKEIRDQILITNPADRPVFTAEEMELSSGEPNKPSDQDTYEALMTMEDKEIRFWMAHPEFEIPFLSECGMEWETIKNDYLERMERERELGIDNTRKTYQEVLKGLKMADIDLLEEEGKFPTKLEKIITIDPVTGNFVAKEYPDIVIGTVNDMIEAVMSESDSFIE